MKTYQKHNIIRDQLRKQSVIENVDIVCIVTFANHTIGVISRAQSSLDVFAVEEIDLVNNEIVFTTKVLNNIENVGSISHSLRSFNECDKCSRVISCTQLF